MSDKHAHGHAHSHMWVVGLLGIGAGLAFMIYVPQLESISRGIFLFAGFHLAGAVILLASLYLMAWRDLTAHWLPRRAAPTAIRFGWEPAWVYGPSLAALTAVASAAALLSTAAAWWPVAILLVLLGAGFLAGFLFTRASTQPDFSPLPMVDLLSGTRDLVLDAGCGAGRTTLAVARIVREGTIVALDRFDSDYIDRGGRALLENNVRLAGLTERVRVEQGDLSALPFADATFDSAVSAHAIDHLGAQKLTGLREMRRVLKPGGRFLLAVWVPGWAMFAVVNFFAWFLTPKNSWRRMAGEAGFRIVDQGHYSGIWFMLLERPEEAE